MSGDRPWAADQPFIIEETMTREARSPLDDIAIVETDDSAPINPLIASTPAAVAGPGARPAAARRRGGAAAAALGLVGLLGILAILWLQSLLNAQPWLGVLASVFVGLILAGSLGLALGEVRALSRLTHAQEFRRRIEGGLADRAEAERLLRGLGRSLERVPALAPGVARWQAGFRPEHPPADMLALFDGLVLAPADAAALAVSRRAVRIAFGLVALSPTALSDTVLFWYRALRLVREIADIYGYRPSRAATLVLAQRALRDAGLLATADIAGDAVGHFLGGKMLERVSTAAAEGAVAGYRMGRFALLVMECCRPMPFTPGNRPSLLDLLPRLLP